MNDISNRLRTAREQAGLSIEEISERTRIKAGMLRALERGDLSHLPGQFYTKTFIRAFAREVGLPADELVIEFMATTGAPAAPPAVRVQDIDPVRGIARFETPTASSWQLIPIAGVVIALLFFGLRWRADEGPGQEPGAIGTAGPAAAELPVGSGGAPSAGPGAALQAPAERLALDIRPSATVWVAAKADGEQVLFRLLNPGERARVEAAEEITLRVGNAGAFVYTINGAEGVMLGAPGEVRDIRVTRENYRTYRR